MTDTWNDWDSSAFTPPPLPSFPERPAKEPAQPAAEPAAPPANTTRWSLVSMDGRATMRVPKRFVVGSGACCDLRLSERGIDSHHAMLSVEEGIAYVTPLSDKPTLLDGQPLVGRRRLHRDAALAFGAATFRVQHEGPLEARDEDPGEVPRPDEPVVSRRAAPQPAPAEPRRTATPHISPQIDLDARLDQLAAGRPRKSSARFAWLVAAAAVVGVALALPPMDALMKDLHLDAASTPIAPAEPMPAAVPPPAPSDASSNRQTVVETPQSPITRPEPTQPVERTTVAAAPVPVPPPVSETPAADATGTLLSEADALFAKGNRVTPQGRNAAEHYVRVLQTEPGSQVARARLDKLVSGVAGDASDMILRQRFDGARRSIEQLAVAIPESRRALVGKDARNQWRVVELLLDADALMQDFRIDEPDNPNAVALLREAQRIDPRNAIADEMLAKAYGLQAERQKRE